jgi:hypothetical protein
MFCCQQFKAGKGTFHGVFSDDTSIKLPIIFSFFDQNIPFHKIFFHPTNMFQLSFLFLSVVFVEILFLFWKKHICMGHNKLYAFFKSVIVIL